MCCKCNRTGLCRGCACVKAGKPCVNCLPSKLGNCVNASTTGSSYLSVPTSTAQTSASTIPAGTGNASASSTQATSVSTTQTPSIFPIGAHRDSGVLQPQPVPSTTGTLHSPVNGPEDRPTVIPPPSRPVPDQQPLNFCWGEHTGQAIFDAVNSTYEVVVHWKPNLFLVPFGSAGTSFVKLKSDAPNVKQVWYADDATGAGTCDDLRAFWDSLQIHGVGYGYHPNATKTHLVVKAEHATKARELFAGTGVNVTTEGKRHLGAAVGSRSYMEEYVTGKVTKWCDEIKQLATIAQTQPHAAYSAYTHGLSSRWTFLSRTIPNIADLLQPLEDAIQHHLIPALTGRPPCSRVERDLLALPVRLGGVGIVNPVSNSQHMFEASVRLTTPLIAAIATQDQDQLIDTSEVMEIKSSIRKSNRDHQKHLAESVYDRLSPQLKRFVDLAREKGTSSWLSVLPLDDHGFSLHKGEFRDALCLRYGWKLSHTPAKCNCGLAFSADHAMICHMGGFPTIRHNELRDVTASLLTEVCNDVATEPHLQPLSGESMTLRSAITDDGARLDIRARGFWAAAQDAYFDVRVFHPNAPSNCSGSISVAYKKHEDIKKRAYGQRVREIEHGVFTPLVFSTTGGMGREATTFYKRLADKLAWKQQKPYSVVMSWLRCKLSFAAIRSSIMCIRGSRSSTHRPVRDADITLATSEGFVPLQD